MCVWMSVCVCVYDECVCRPSVCLWCVFLAGLVWVCLSSWPASPSLCMVSASMLPWDHTHPVPRGTHTPCPQRYTHTLSPEVTRYLLVSCSNSSSWSPDWFGLQSDGLSLAQHVTSFFTLLTASKTHTSTQTHLHTYTHIYTNTYTHTHLHTQVKKYIY